MKSTKIRTICFSIHPRNFLEKVYKPFMRKFTWRLEKHIAHFFPDFMKYPG